MAYTRSNMVTFLNDSGIVTIATELANTKDDTATGYKNAIDQALLEYGTAYIDLVTATVANADILKFNKVLRYFTLRLLAETCAVKVDIRTDTPSPQKSYSQLFKHIKALMDEAKSEAQADGYLEDVTSMEGQIGYDEFLIDMVEPEEVET